MVQDYRTNYLSEEDVTVNKRQSTEKPVKTEPRVDNETDLNKLS